ncbi:MAG: glycosyltransferase family 4 protein [Elusimicrobia bacterium]|nr:glycosyltransferase family 4 protein [Elusimicrobiota bacterium]
MNASCVEETRVRLEPWAKAEDPGWDQRGTDSLMAAAWSVNANSAWTKAYTAYWCPKHASRIKVVYYGAPAADAFPEGVRHGGPSGLDPAPAAPAFPWPYIVCVARLAEYKGIDVLAMAFAEVVGQGEDVGLVLVGADHSRGQLFTFIERLGIADRVRWLGQQPHARVLELLRGCELFVLPSRRESLGGAAIEAMAAGKAVVASRTGGIPELVTDGREGILVEPKEPAALARAMLKLLRDPAERSRMGAAAREKSRRFSWDRALDAYARDWSSHPAWRPGAAVGFAIWDSGADQTCQAIAASVMDGFRRKAQPFCLCWWRSTWGEPFRSEVPGGRVYRVGLPGSARTALLDPVVVAAQLLWIAAAERVGVWHVLVIRYRRLRGLRWFLRAARQSPVVTLA